MARQSPSLVVQLAIRFGHRFSTTVARIDQEEERSAVLTAELELPATCDQIGKKPVQKVSRVTENEKFLSRSEERVVLLDWQMEPGLEQSQCAFLYTVVTQARQSLAGVSQVDEARTDVPGRIVEEAHECMLV